MVGKRAKRRAETQDLRARLPTLQRLAPFPLNRAPADVAAAETLGPVDPVDRRVGARLCLRHGTAAGTDVEHAAAIGHDAATLLPGAGVKDLHAVDARGVVEPLDHRALGI